VVVGGGGGPDRAHEVVRPPNGAELADLSPATVDRDPGPAATSWPRRPPVVRRPRAVPGVLIWPEAPTRRSLPPAPAGNRLPTAAAAPALRAHGIRPGWSVAARGCPSRPARVDCCSTEPRPKYWVNCHDQRIPTSARRCGSGARSSSVPSVDVGRGDVPPPWARAPAPSPIGCIVRTRLRGGTRPSRPRRPAWPGSSGRGGLSPSAAGGGGGGDLCPARRCVAAPSFDSVTSTPTGQHGPDPVDAPTIREHTTRFQHHVRIRFRSGLAGPSASCHALRPAGWLPSHQADDNRPARWCARPGG